MRDNPRQNNPRYNTSAIPIGMDFGKVPPVSIEAETAVLGALLLSPSSIYEISDKLVSEAFYKDEHQKICTAIVNLHNDNKRIDGITVAEQLKKEKYLDEVGGQTYLNSLMSSVASAAHIKEHYFLVYGQYMKREVIRVAANLHSGAFDDGSDPDDLIDFMNTQMDEVNEKNAGGRMSAHISTFTKGSEESLRAREAAVKQGKMRGIPTPWKRLNEMLQGWQPGLIFIGARPSIGKCLGKGTKVLMFNGQLKNVEDVITGDLLMGPDSQPKTVLSTCIGRDQMYNINHKNGFGFRCNAEHILALKVSGKDFQRQYGKYKEVSVKDFFKLPVRLQQKLKGFKVGVEFPENNNLGIDPYILGIWLGDGAKKDFDISNPDIEVHKALKEFADAESIPFRVFKSKTRCDSVILTNRSERYSNPNNMVARLKTMNLRNNKHIPNEYLFNSSKNRLQLLAGLLDADGYLCEGSGYEITQKDETLAYQILHLCNTLGFGTSIKRERKGIKSRGFYGLYYRIHITGDVFKIPLKIKRKIAPIKTRKNYATTYGITITKDIVDDYYGFELDGDGLFLLENCTVTHNTAIALAIGEAAAKSGSPTNIFSLETSGIRLTDRLLLAKSDMQAGNFRSGYMSAKDWAEFNKAKEALNKLPLYIDDNPYVGFNYLKARLRIMKKKGLCKLAIFDYLQLSSVDDNKNRDRSLGEFTRKCKNLAQELDLPIILLCQLNREAEARPDKKPEVSDIRETGSAEGDADVIILLHRPERYGITEDRKGNDHKGKIYLLLRKQKDGPIGDVTLTVNESLTKFKDYVEVVPSQQNSNRDRQLPPEKEDIEPELDPSLPF